MFHDSFVAFGFPCTKCRLISIREIIYSAIYFSSLPFYRSLARSSSRVDLSTTNIYFRTSLFFPTFDPFFSTDSLAPTIRAFSFPYYSPLCPLCIRPRRLFTSCYELFVNATRMIYVNFCIPLSVPFSTRLSNYPADREAMTSAAFLNKILGFKRDKYIFIMNAFNL